MTLNGDYKEFLRKTRDGCILNIFEYYKEILYGKMKILSNANTRELDELMLIKITQEFNNFTKEIE